MWLCYIVENTIIWWSDKSWAFQSNGVWSHNHRPWGILLFAINCCVVLLNALITWIIFNRCRF